MTEHHSSRRAKARKKDTERQQKRRKTLKEAGAPTTHVLNRAIAEGFFYWLDAERAKGVHVGEATIRVQQVLLYATRVLSRHTNATDHYDSAKVAHALRVRIHRTSMTKFRIRPVWSASDMEEND